MCKPSSWSMHHPIFRPCIFTLHVATLSNLLYLLSDFFFFFTVFSCETIPLALMFPPGLIPKILLFHHSLSVFFELKFLTFYKDFQNVIVLWYGFRCYLEIFSGILSSRILLFSLQYKSPYFIFLVFFIPLSIFYVLSLMSF